MTDGDLRGPGGVGGQEEPTETPQAPRGAWAPPAYGEGHFFLLVLGASAS